MMTAQVSIFRGKDTTTPVGSMTLGAMLGDIQNGTYRKPVEHLRSLLAKGNEKAYKAARDSGLAFTPGCELSSRSKDVPWGKKFVGASGIIHYDLDDLDDAEAVKRQLTQDPHVCFAFVSPSGRGLKVGLAADGIAGPT